MVKGRHEYGTQNSLDLRDVHRAHSCLPVETYIPRSLRNVLWYVWVDISAKRKRIKTFLLLFIFLTFQFRRLQLGLYQPFLLLLIPSSYASRP